MVRKKWLQNYQPTVKKITYFLKILKLLKFLKRQHLKSNFKLSAESITGIGIGFALLCSVTGPKDSCHSLHQSGAKLKPITTWSPAFSRTLGSLVGFTLSSQWLLEVIPFF